MNLYPSYSGLKLQSSEKQTCTEPVEVLDGFILNNLSCKLELVKYINNQNTENRPEILDKEIAALLQKYGVQDIQDLDCQKISENDFINLG